MSKKVYLLYKGLQRPLVFKMFKGRFIYWAVGSIVAGIIGGIISGIVISSIAGIIAMAVISGPLLLMTIEKQKKGLYEKRVDDVIFIVSPKHFIRRKYESKEKV